METLSSISRLKEQLDETGDLSFCSAVKSYMSDKQGVLDRSPSSIASPAAVTTTRGISETVEPVVRLCCISAGLLFQPRKSSFVRVSQAVTFVFAFINRLRCLSCKSSSSRNRMASNSASISMPDDDRLIDLSIRSRITSENISRMDTVYAIRPKSGSSRMNVM